MKWRRDGALCDRHRMTGAGGVVGGAAQAAESLYRTGCLLVRDWRVKEEDNTRFLDLLERYFESSDGERDARPQLGYQVRQLEVNTGLSRPSGGSLRDTGQDRPRTPDLPAVPLMLHSEHQPAPRPEQFRALILLLMKMSVSLSVCCCWWRCCWWLGCCSLALPYASPCPCIFLCCWLWCQMQVGVTPAFAEQPRNHCDRIARYPEEDRPRTLCPPEADPKWRFFWRIVSSSRRVLREGG